DNYPAGYSLFTGTVTHTVTGTYTRTAGHIDDQVLLKTEFFAVKLAEMTFAAQSNTYAKKSEMLGGVKFKLTNPLKMELALPLIIERLVINYAAYGSDNDAAPARMDDNAAAQETGGADTKAAAVSVTSATGTVKG